MIELIKTKSFWLLLLIAAASSVVLYFSTFHLLLARPLYPDEIAYRISNSRALIDGVLSFTSPILQCSSADNLTGPFFWVPGRIIDSLFYGFLEEPAQLRMAGILHFIALAVLLCALVFKLSRSTGETVAGFIFVFSALAAGHLPFVQIFTRPETDMLIALLLLILLAIRQSRSNETKRNLTYAFVYVLIFSFLAQLHPETAFFFPLVLFCAISLTRFYSRLWRGLYFGFLSIACVQSLRMQIAGRFNCPDAADAIEKISSAQQLLPSLLMRDPIAFFKKSVENLAGFYQYFVNISFQTSYPANWMPPEIFGSPIVGSVTPEFLSNTVLLIGWTSVLVAIVYFLLLNTYIDFRRKRVSQHLWLAVLLVIATLSMAAIQVTKNFYQSALILPLLMLVLLISYSAVRSTRGAKVIFCLVIVCLFSSAVISRAVAALKYSAWTSGAPVGLGVRTVGPNRELTDESRRQLVEASKLCGFSQPEKLSYLMIDDLTYFAFLKSTKLRSYTYSSWVAAEMGDPYFNQFWDRAFSSEAPGLILRCFDGALFEAPMKRVGNFCCMNRAMIEAYRAKLKTGP